MHVLYWLQNTPCKTVRGKQVLAIPISSLEKYLISLEPEYVRILLAGLHIHDMEAVLYRLTLEGGAKMYIKQPNNERRRLLAKLDRFTRGRIEAIMSALPKDFYISTRES